LPMPDEEAATAQWRRFLTGEVPSLHKVRRMWQRVPAAPRGKVCASPFHGIGGAVARLFWHGPMRDNPLLCKACFGHLAQRAGGAELEISVVFAAAVTRRSTSRLWATRSTSPPDSVTWRARVNCSSAARPGIGLASARHLQSAGWRSPDGRAA